MVEGKQLVCLQIHNDYQIPGGETKTAYLIGDLLERSGIRVIRYYKTNMEYANAASGVAKIKTGLHSLNNPRTTKEINEILDREQVDFALVHNVVSVISNAAYKTLIKRGVPIIKYLQNYNMVCLNGALDHAEACNECQRNNLTGVKCKCYKGSTAYSFIKYLIKQDMDKHIRPHIAAFMPNSAFVMNEHVARGIDGNKMHLMYNYVDIPLIPYNEKREYYLYFGRLSSEKGVMTTISAFENMPEKKLIIMGSGPLVDVVKERASKRDNIEFIGSRTGTELFEYVAKAKAVIVPSEWDEPLPRTTLEAYSQGTPVIGADRGGIPEMIREGQTGFIFRAGNVEALTEAVIAVEALTAEDYEKLRENCLKRLDAEYTEAAYFNRFMRCVKEII